MKKIFAFIAAVVLSTSASFASAPMTEDDLMQAVEFFANGQIEAFIECFDCEEQCYQTISLILEDDPSMVNFYNAACVYCIAGEFDTAWDCLTAAIDLGFDDVEQLMTDPDLENFRKIGAFDSLFE